jgi:hypothetical protein
MTHPIHCKRECDKWLARRAVKTSRVSPRWCFGNAFPLERQRLPCWRFSCDRLGFRNETNYSTKPLPVTSDR